MSIATIASDLVDTLRDVSGIGSVFIDEPHGTDAMLSAAERSDGSRVHFWLVKVAPTTSEPYAGGYEPRSSILIEAWMGVARDEAGREDKSDREFAELVARVRDALTATSARFPGGCVETTQPEVRPIGRRVAQVGVERVPCHYAQVAYVAQEE